jgi:uncharacterized protein YceH (UPF0502 family)
MITLTPTEARIVASLVEKSMTTPQYYPMTVNAVMLACNQKSCRNPQLSLTEGEVSGALQDLEARGFTARDEHSGRVVKWRQRFANQLLLKGATQGVLATLMLRGPQTASELRANAVGIGGPADGEGLAAAINDLADRAQPLVALLPRAPGQKEARYAHLLSGTPDQAAPALDTVQPTAPTRSDLDARVAALEARMAELERQLGIGGQP